MLVRLWRSLLTHQRKSWGTQAQKWGQGPTTSATGSAAEPKKKTAKSSATIVRENEEIKNDLLK